jgi:hypothetical protein
LSAGGKDRQHRILRLVHGGNPLGFRLEQRRGRLGARRQAATEQENDYQGNLLHLLILALHNNK